MANLLALHIQDLDRISIVAVVRFAPADDHLADGGVAIVVPDTDDLVIKRAVQAVAVLLLIIALCGV